MDCDDFVDPGYAAVQALLALTAENTDDHEKRDLLVDAILTLPPLTEWATVRSGKGLRDGKIHHGSRCSSLRLGPNHTVSQ